MMENDSRLPLVSVIVPVRNGEATLDKCIRSILELDCPREDFEVIVVNDGSTDGTAEVIKKHQGIKVVTTPGVGPAQARNLALMQARGDYVAFTDADCRVERTWLRSLHSGFVDERVAGVGGNQESPDDETGFGRAVMEFFKALGFLGGYVKSPRVGTPVEASHNPACNVMYRKRPLTEIKGFDPSLWPGEDVDLDYRLRQKGYRVRYAPGAIVHHYQPADYPAFIRKVYRYGKSSGGYLTRRYGFFRNVSYIPWILSVAAFFMIGAVALYPPAGYVLIGFSLASPFFVFLHRVRKGRIALRMWALFVCAVAFWNVGFFRGVTMKRTA